MNIWVIQTSEPLPWLDKSVRYWRSSLLTEELLKRGNEVVYWAPTFEHHTKKCFAHLPSVIFPKEGLEIQLMHGRKYKKHVSFARLLSHHSVAREFKKQAVLEPNPDVVICALPNLQIAEAVVNYGKATGVPVIIDVQDPWPDVYLNAVPTFMRPIFKWLIYSEFRRASRICKGATALVGISNSYLDWALKNAGRVANKYDFVAVLGYQRCPVGSGENKSDYSDKLLAVFAGGFGVSYDLKSLVDCAGLLHSEKCESIHIVLAGFAEKESELKKRAGSFPNIEFAGRLSSKELRELYEKADVGLCAYNTNATQSLPYKPFEYMAAGLPLLSSLSGELAEMIDKERIGLQYTAGDAVSLARQLRYLSENRDECTAMGMRAKNLFERRFRSDIIYPPFADMVEKIAREARK
ncbi:MAG: glycosyltransferase family 4 protein [Lentisphaerae bacterium]|jgi:glycosyltransferase involved in cell wall biosynthesis|nr:glycosyltransferase family 4 protein [Lentisphaerota bacterium]